MAPRPVPAWVVTACRGRAGHTGAAGVGRPVCGRATHADGVGELVQTSLNVWKEGGVREQEYECARGSELYACVSRRVNA